MNYDTRTVDLDRLNSLTKYPSIPTYHTLGQRQCLTEEVLVPFPPEDEVIGTEKIDGTNARLIILPDDYWMIGSRDDLLYCAGDILQTPDPTGRAVVATLKPLANSNRMANWTYLVEREPDIRVLFFEVYGGNVTKAGKQYTGNINQLGCRLFDVVILNPHEANDRWGWEDLLSKPKEQIASWRDHGGQPYLGEHDLQKVADALGVELTPRVSFTGPPPKDLDATYLWLKQAITKSYATLDPQAGGRPEGLVLRTADRKRIAKLRFEDYERTFRQTAPVKPIPPKIHVMRENQVK